jgi:transposase
MNDTPKAVINLVKCCKEDYQLILWLDGEAFAEFSTDSKAEFSKALNDWKKVNLPTLSRSVYKIYVRGKKKLIEADF